MTSTKRMGAAAIGFAVSTLIAFGQPMAAEKTSGTIANKTPAPQITKFKCPAQNRRLISLINFPISSVLVE